MTWLHKIFTRLRSEELRVAKFRAQLKTMAFYILPCHNPEPLMLSTFVRLLQLGKNDKKNEAEENHLDMKRL